MMPVHPSPSAEHGVVEKPLVLVHPVYVNPVEVAYPAHVNTAVNYDANQTYCNFECLKVSFFVGITYIFVLVLLGSLSALFWPLAILLAISPAAMILFFLEREYHHAVTRCQMVTSFFEAILWMIPLIGVLIFYTFFIERSMGFPDEGLCPACVAGYSFRAYFIAGTLEELLKYIAVVRLLYHPSIVDPRALVIYGCCAAAGFATAENISYVLSTGSIATGISRAILSVPLHCSTGIFIGCMLAERRFNNKKYSWVAIVLPCVVLHGTYNLILYLTYDGSGEAWAVLCGLVADMLVVVISYMVLRAMVLRLQRQFPPVDLHAMIMNGDAPIPVQACAGTCSACCML